MARMLFMLKKLSSEYIKEIKKFTSYRNRRKISFICYRIRSRNSTFISKADSAEKWKITLKYF